MKSLQLGILSALAITVSAGILLLQPQGYRQLTFAEPIDAISFGMPTDTIAMEVSGQVNGAWTDWQELEIEKEFDPTLRESNLIIFPGAVTAVRIRGAQESYEPHPLRLAQDPPSYEVAARTRIAAPRILSRKQWGADDSYLYNGKKTGRSDVTVSEDGEDSPRSQDCKEAKRRYAREFDVTKTVTHGPNGKQLRWAQRYSPDVHLLVVHHTAQKATNDKRESWERMRLLYAYHANSRGWGDIGYNYIIDDEGQIYEGRAGGKYVVGGHAFCANVGTLGIALMGNFEEEQPTQEQMKSLQWLIKKLAVDYDIDLSKKVRYHGTNYWPVVGHKDLVQTSCPGYYVRETLTQVRRNVVKNRIETAIRFPRGPRRKSNNSDPGIPWFSNHKKATLTAIGSTDVMGRPGSQARVSVQLKAGDSNIYKRDRIADVSRSDSSIGVWQDTGGREMRVRKELVAANNLRSGETMQVNLRLQFPRKAGIYTLRVGNVPFVLTAKGRALGASKDAPVRKKLDLYTSLTKGNNSFSRPSFGLVRRPPRIARAKTAAWEAPNSSDIRIRLSYPGSSASIHVGKNTDVNGNESDRHRLDLRKEGDACVATEYGKEMGRGKVRIKPGGDGIFKVTSWERTSNSFRGILECQIVDGELALINELPLEQYMAGLAEEPDSEPYEKQRAFAVAARSYAAHYMSPSYRKFPGKPYDGNDSPANFQKYTGVTFERSNPRWVQAVQSTRSLVIKKNGVIVKTPYFSADSGRTNSPKDVGWNRFPFAEVFQSKPDPWCEGEIPRGHGVGMSGCGARGQAREGKKAEAILKYYYPTTEIAKL